MSNPWLILGTLAFWVSFGMNLLMSQNLGGSLVAGMTALGTAFATAAVVNRYHNRSSESRLAGLKHQLRQLQRQYQLEEEALWELVAEKERVGTSLNGLQMQLRQYQLAGAGGPMARPMLSWDLSAEAEEAIADLPYGRAIAPGGAGSYDPVDGGYGQADGVMASPQAQAIAQAQHWQTELAQLQAQVSDHRYLREQLILEMQQLGQKHEQLEVQAIALRQEVAELERCRQEGDQYLAYLESKRQEIETGTNPLQKALQQLQNQVDASRAELQTLEQRIAATRQEKVLLERELANTKQHQKRVTILQETVHELTQQRITLEQAIATCKQQHADQQTALDQAIAAQTQAQADLHTIQEQVRSLGQQKTELEQHLSPLQEQQEHLARVQTVLQELDQQVSDRRQEKEQLELYLAQLMAAPLMADPLMAAPPMPDSQPGAVDPELPEPPTTAAPETSELFELPDLQPTRPKPAKVGKAKPSQPSAIAPSGPAKPSSESALTATNGAAKASLKSRPQPTLTIPVAADDGAEPARPAANGLPDLWTDLMVQLPDYELQALQTIANRKNVLQTLGQLAQDNFVSVDELLELINQRALQTVGEAIIHAPSGFNPPSIVRSQTRLVQRLIETYEYLTQ